MDNQHLPADYFSHSHRRRDVVNEPLYVITPVFNSKRFRSRWKLYADFENYILSNDQAHLVTIECSYGNRERVITEKASAKHTIIHVRSQDELWLKENLINRAIQALPETAKYLAWIDADIVFARPDWVGETLHKLQHYAVVQLFSKAADLTPQYEILTMHTGFMWCYHKEQDVWQKFHDAGYGSSGETKKLYKHPGFAWAMRKETFNQLGGLIDWSILGGGDMFMAYALVGALDERNMPKSLGPAGVERLYQWQERAEKYVRRNVGYVEGMVLHYWHGKKANRRYNDRGQILVDADFCPNKDLWKDWQGLYQLNPENYKLRDGIRRYFSGRDEDSIDL